jgi:tRNA threonylcarbamoyladenosine biosynthesis protein TsaE
MNVTVSDLVVSVATPADAAGMVAVIHAAFGARPTLTPPSTAIDETADSVAEAIAAGGGIFALVDGQPAGALIITPVANGRVSFSRVSVHPEFQRHGIASAMVAAAQDYAAELGFTSVELFARAEIPEVVRFWQHREFVIQRPAPYGMILGRHLPIALEVPTAEAMQLLGAALAYLLRPGDVIIASGDLGAGKTTLTQGIGAGLDTTGPVISPTFVLSRVHASRSGRPALVHVDAYRLSSAEELDDLDLDASLAEAVTVVEWGAGLAEGLSDSRLEVDIRRAAYPYGSAEHADHRVVIIRGHGRRWADVDLGMLTASVVASNPSHG